MASILYTFDYEIFLGKKSGLAKDDLIKPVDDLIKIFDKYSVKSIFFVDTIYLLRLKELSSEFLSIKQDYELISLQIKTLIKKGHYVYIHLHPHWLDAKFIVEMNQWDLSVTNRYRISSLHPVLIRELVFKSQLLLEGITGLDRTHFNGYRAGGWSIQPFSCFWESFKEFNIRYEFSVIPGKFFKSNIQYFNFKLAPEKIKYNFESDVCIEKINGSFVQFPISTYTISKYGVKIDKFYNDGKYILSKLAFKKSASGSTVNANVEYFGDVIEKPNCKRVTASFEDMNLIRFAFLYREYKKNGYLHTVSHPKILKKTGIFYLKLFIKIVHLFENPNSDFKNI